MPRGMYIRKPFTERAKKNMSLARLGKKIPSLRGKNHYLWKGNKVGYYALHEWLRKHYGKANKCENVTCKYPRLDKKGHLMQKPSVFHWALKRGKNYKRDITCFMQLCISCHVSYDIETSRMFHRKQKQTWKK